MQITGTVQDVSSQVKTSNKTGKKFRVHYIELDSGEVVNVGFNNPYKVGQSLNLEVEQAYGEMKLVTGAPSSGGGSAPAPKKDSGSFGARAPASGRPFPVPKTSGEIAIIRQNALTNAVTMFCNGALEFVPNKDEMKSVDELVEEVLKMAYAFAEFSSGNREVRLAADMEARANKRARKVVKEEEDEEETTDG